MEAHKATMLKAAEPEASSIAERIKNIETDKEFLKSMLTHLKTDEALLTKLTTKEQ